MVTLQELEQAHKEWIIAQQEFNLAEPEFVEDATHRLTAAELKYNTLLRLAKQKGVQADGKKDMSECIYKTQKTGRRRLDRSDMPITQRKKKGAE